MQEELKFYCRLTQSHFIDTQRGLYVIGVEQIYEEFLNSKIYYRRDLHIKKETNVTSYIFNMIEQNWS